MSLKKHRKVEFILNKQRFKRTFHVLKPVVKNTYEYETEQRKRKVGSLNDRNQVAVSDNRYYGTEIIPPVAARWQCNLTQ